MINTVVHGTSGQVATIMPTNTISHVPIVTALLMSIEPNQ